MSKPFFYVTPVASSVPFDNSIDGFTSTDVQSAIEEGVNKNQTYEATATGTTTTTTNTQTLLNGMTLSPPAGTYLAFFSTTINVNSAGAAVSVQLYNNGVADANTARFISPFDGGTLSATSANGAISINKVITVTTGAVTIEWSTGGGTATCAARTLTLLRIG